MKSSNFMFDRSNFKLFIISILLISQTFLFGQINDSTVTKNDVTNKQESDSLKVIVDSLSQRIKKLELILIEKSTLDSLLVGIQEVKDTSLIPEDRRSKRRQLDELLEYISKRPGQLFFNGQALAIIQGNVVKNDKFATAQGSIDIFATNSFSSSSILFIDIKAIGGKGPDMYSETLGSLNGDASSVPDVDNFDRILVNEAWAEFLFLNNIFTITAGKINLTNYFDNNSVANDPYTQFITGIFINNPAFAVPLNSPGIRIRTTLLNRFYMQVAFAKVDNTGDNIFKGIFKAAELGFKLLPFTKFEANVHLYGYSQPSADHRYGFGISVDQTIAGFFKVFGRFGNNENILADWYGIKSSWSAGAQFKENILGEPTIIGLGSGLTKPADNSLKNEKNLEFYLRQSLNKWTSISAHLQHVLDTGGVNGKYTLLGLRVNFTF
ncbi:MAG: hypothetical protein P8X47_00610 [Ignavibacteriaceae bacterium]